MPSPEENPFTPSFGEIPPLLVGREAILSDLRRAFESGSRRPDLTTLFYGARGTGKTALLSVAAREAEARGWATANVMAMPGMLDDILIQARRASRHLVKDGPKAHVTGLGLGEILQVDLSRDVREPSNWRSNMSDLLDSLSEEGAGLLITVDEVQASLDEVIQLAAIYQLFIREQRRVALLMAGLPHNISALITDKSVSFLRRAQSRHLGRLTDYEVERAIRRTVTDAGRLIDDEAIKRAVAASGGFPFLMQLVGYRMWEANPETPTITARDAEVGIAEARSEMDERILRATYMDLSDGDVRFLMAMACDKDVSSMGDIARRMGKSNAYAHQYKLRLLEQGVIGERGRGRVGFDLPFMREYVLSHDRQQ